MKAQLKYSPDLRDCVLEDRLVPVIPNLGPGAIVLTAGGYVLVMSPFPVSVADPLGTSGSPGFLTPSAMTGGGSSSLLPANSTGVPGQAATSPNGSNGRVASTIFVGSGANDAVAPIIPLVTRNTIANDALNATPRIGRVLGDRSDVLPPEQVYRGGLPVSASGGVSTEASGQRFGPNPDERPVDPLPIRLRSRPHRLASGASGSPVRSHADRAP
ncbi:MAG: hypothetical protein ACHP93_07030 [Solirubrobacterales bacterium]